MEVKIIERPRAKKRKADEKDLKICETLKSNFFYRNFIVDALKKSFPFAPSLWAVDKYFPETYVGKIFIDEPKNEWELKKSLKKKEALDSEGFIFLIKEPNEDIEDALKKLVSKNDNFS